MRRAKLLCLEKKGLVQETYGYGRSFTLNGVDSIPPTDDPMQDEKLRVYMMRKANDEAAARARRVARLRTLARMDFKLLGGVAPVGFYGGAGGGNDSVFRSVSMGARG